MKRQQLSTLKDGARFVYGGVEWVKLEHLHTAPGDPEYSYNVRYVSTDGTLGNRVRVCGL